MFINEIMSPMCQISFSLHSRAQLKSGSELLIVIMSTTVLSLENMRLSSIDKETFWSIVA